MTIVARDVMERDVLSIGPDATLDELESFLIEHRVGGAAVTEGGRLVGVVSRSDVVRTLNLGRVLEGYIAEELATRGNLGDDPEGRLDLPAEARECLAGKKVRDAMTSGPITVTVDAPIRDVARATTTHRIHRVFVTEGDLLVGVISTLDLAKLIADDRI